jgi:hypothetical protein
VDIPLAAFEFEIGEPSLYRYNLFVPCDPFPVVGHYEPPIL